MSLLKAICISFSIYSKIPMPHFDWKEKEMRYQLIFFPWVGAVMGIIFVLWNQLCIITGINELPRVLILTAIPLLVTGGFHVDGFMDTMDALKSYKTREEKLEILKDPHIGAFSVIMLAVLGLIYISALSQLDRIYISVLACGFFYARALSGMGVLVLKNAKNKGMLNTFNKTASDSKRTVLISLIIQTALCIAFMIFLNVKSGIVLSVVGIIVFLYYKHMSEKNFGGITGDTAGYFVTVCEASMAVAAAITGFF